jgi:hypothetical protein
MKSLLQLRPLFCVGVGSGTLLLMAATGLAGQVTGDITDTATHEPLAARLYVQSATGERFFAESAAQGGRAVRYAKTNWFNPRAIEFHTTLPAGGFRIELPPGQYTFVAEHGKEFLSTTQTLTVGTQPVRVNLSLRRWSNVAARGWFSGDTHVHRTQEELPTLLLAEDLNVALPQTYWVTKAFTPPTTGDRNESASLPSELVRVDDRHVIWPRNTEYEFFHVGDRQHTLGAVFLQNHGEPLTLAGPPMAAIADEARRQGALLDLDKHDWPWAMMLPPVMRVDLFGLVNNHLWRTEFGVTNWFTPAPAFMGLPNDGKWGNERDWIDYGCQSYYALLNCGFRMRPTAGTASGVHPVPLGFGRVYVHCPKGFSYDAWMKGLGEGRSFVTTGPMLLAEINGEVPGATFPLRPGKSRTVKLRGTVTSETPVTELEVLMNGELTRTIPLRARPTKAGAYEAKFSERLTVSGTTWVALRVWEQREGGRVRFAHTAPTWFDDASRPLHPRRVEVEWLVEKMRGQIEREQHILPPAAIDEYRQALEVYQQLLSQAR